MTKKLLVLIVILGGILLLNANFRTANKAKAFHSEAELTHYKMMMGGNGLPEASNDLFAASGKCVICHGHDPDGNANINSNDVDVNVVDAWRSTMMANSAKDPFWRAKVSHETLVNPSHQADLEDKCTSCHAPMGHFNAKHLGQTHYSIAAMEQDPVALDGVSCNACHQITNDSLGLLFSGNVKYDTDYFLYGPYTNPLGAPMIQIGYEPIFSNHINDAGLCASCHTLITETVDLDGNYTGNHFVEQATYHEWINSIYEDSISCQGCHIPRIADSIVISADPPFLQKRSPYGLHELVGGNTFMLKLFQENINGLGITATTTQFDSTISRTERMLRYQTLDIGLTETNRTGDTVFFEVKLKNKAGHKFPSGYPSRRAFVEFVVRDANLDTIFRSGILDYNYEVSGHDANYEPHYNMINQPEQAQIYEMVMGDVNGDKTTVLERAMAPIKDNRLPPTGFTSTHFSYDTTLVAGNALNDVDFNVENSTEGSGTDIVHYHVPLQGYADVLHISARVYYQPVPPLWNQEMLAFTSSEIDAFKNLYMATDGTPSLVAEALLESEPVGIKENQVTVKVYPNPFSDFLIITTESQQQLNMILYDSNGQLVHIEPVRGHQKINVKLLNLKPGVYYYQLENKNGITKTGKLVKTN